MSDISFQRLVVLERCGVTVALKDRSPCDDATVNQIGEELCQLAKDRTPILVIDFSAIEFFEANLRGQLVRVYKALTSRAGRLAVCHLPPGMKEHFAMIQFDHLMLVADTLEEAVGYSTLKKSLKDPDRDRAFDRTKHCT